VVEISLFKFPDEWESDQIGIHRGTGPGKFFPSIQPTSRRGARTVPLQWGGETLVH